MEKYKLCPVCGTKNIPVLFECLSCEADLTGVKITDEATEKMAEVLAQDAEKPSMSPVLVRICDCGVSNLANARKCSACGEDISDITPEEECCAEAQQSTSTFLLESVDGTFSYQIENGDITIGREHSLREYLASKRFVSRIHATLTLDQDGLFVENLSQTNFTYVNNQRITDRVVLKHGDELALGGNAINGQRQSDAAYFIVRMNECM